MSPKAKSKHLYLSKIMNSFISLLSKFRSKSHASYRMKPKACSSPCNTELSTKTLVFDVEEGLLRSSSTFPYFMLVALEGGGLLRGLLLLLAYPLVCCLSQEMGIGLMVMISFCGLKKSSFVVGKVVLPKFLLEDVGLEGFEVMARGKKRVCVSRMPRVMVEWFLKEYLEVDTVVGRELKVFRGFYTGFMEEEKDDCHVEGQIDDGSIGVSSLAKFLDHALFSHCKEIYLGTEAEKRKWHPLPRQKYPKPLIFHDGRIAFRPNPLDATLMFLWLPLALPLSILRIFIGITFPYNLSIPLLSVVGVRMKVKGSVPSKHKARLFVCNHRTLVDPLHIEGAIKSPIAAVTYGLSKMSEILSPIKVVRLTRNREIDQKAMEKLLRLEKNLVMCPEGTTCREPYLLRFSPLFTELTDEIFPIAVDVKISMFYATTVGGFKGFDSLYYFMNPKPCYELEFLDRMDTSKVKAGECSRIEMANLVQGVIGKALGFECTKFSRKDKYMMLAGNNGIVTPGEKISSSNEPKT